MIITSIRWIRDHHPTSKLISKAHGKHNISVSTKTIYRVNIKSDRTLKIYNPKILIPEDDVKLVHRLTHDLNLRSDIT